MKQLKLKALLAIGVMAVTGTASAMQVYLVQNGNRAGSGTLYNAVTNSGGSTWDWTGGVLTQTGTLQSDFYIGSVISGTYYFSDSVSGLVIDTNTASTTAAAYSCIEGPFGAGTGASTCGNYAFNAGGDQSTLTYNVGGAADCSTRTLGGDDTAATPSPFRSLRSWDGSPGCGDHLGRGAMDMTQVVQDFGADQYLILANWNSEDLVSTSTCIATKFSGVNDGGNPNCNRAHWLTFQASPVPVPAAVWLFGSAVGLLGVARRRTA